MSVWYIRYKTMWLSISSRQAGQDSRSSLVSAEVKIMRLYTIRYDTIEEINVDSKAEYTA